jgi:ketosteroid isomerase-like protein
MKSSIIYVAIAIGAAAEAIAGHSTIMSAATGAGEGSMSTATHIRVSDDVAAIRALEDSFAAALNAGDVDAMMKHYVSDNSLVVFDVVPPRQHVGPEEYRKAWQGYFTHFKSTPKFTITDLVITADTSVGFSHSIQRTVGTDTQGHPVDRTVRVTDGYRKIGGKWLIALEHISVPVDLKSGKADFTSKP